MIVHAQFPVPHTGTPLNQVHKYCLISCKPYLHLKVLQLPAWHTLLSNIYTNLLRHSSFFSSIQNGVRPHFRRRNTAWRPAAEPMAHARNGDTAKISMKEVKHDRMVRIEWCEEKAPHIVEVAKNGGWLRLCNLLLVVLYS